MTLVLVRDDGVSVSLGAVIARAGEGTICEVVGQPEWVAKVFHPGLKDLAAKRAKVAAMVASPPTGAVQADGFVVLTWPRHLVESGDGAVGYLMSRVDITNAVEIHTLSNPVDRANPLPTAPQWTPHATWHHLVNTAANLCLAVETVHRVDAVIGDFQERNILVNDTTRVTLVDCDSMQFTDAAGHQFLCGVGRPEFTAPELAGSDLAVAARQKPSDLFALAVHIHLLLMAGNHPFLRGQWTGAGDQPDALTLARSGQWAGGPGSLLHTHPLAPPPDFLPPEIQRLFVRAFTDGATDPNRRPSATEWRTALSAIQVTSCPRGHQIPVEADPCPWCRIDDERSVRRTQRATVAAAAPTQQLPPQRVTPIVPAPAVGYPAPPAKRSRTPLTAAVARRSMGFVAAAMLAAIALTVALVVVNKPNPVPAPKNNATAASPGSTPACARLDTLVSQMPLRQKLAQLLMVGVTDIADARAVVGDYDVGGIFITSGTDKSMLTDGSLQALKSSGPLPLSVSVDEEGGRVQRLSSLLGSQPSPRELAMRYSPEQVREIARERGAKMHGLGITIDFAPVVDVTGAPADTIIGDRSFSADTQTVIEYAGADAQGLRDAGLLPVLKHFPGYGHADGDSHKSGVTTPPLESLKQLDLVPYAELLKTQSPVGVMVGHMQVPGLTGDLQASMSPAAYSLLREGSYGGPAFDGLVFTDDLSQMRAITDKYTVPDAVQTALEAGADVALWSSTAQVPAVLDQLEAAVSSNQLDMGRVDDALRHVAVSKDPTLTC